MSNKKLNIIIVCRNLIGLGIIALIISMFLLFNFKVGFTVFENIENIGNIFIASIIFIWLISVIIIVILFIILLIIYKKRGGELEE